MYKFMQIWKFAKEIFADKQTAQQASEIIEAMLEAHSPRLSDIASRMRGKYEANYKKIQRFLKGTEVMEALHALYNEEADFVIGDVTEIPRPGAKKTAYVGTLKDGKTRGFWMLTMGTPFRGRTLPFHFIVYSSETIAKEASSRNLEHLRAIEEIIHELRGRPLVLDREFSYLSLLENFHAEGLPFVIRLNQGANPPKFYRDSHKKEEVIPTLSQGEGIQVYHQLYYKGVVPVNLAGIWQKGFRKPLWVITSLPPEEGLAMYLQRMKIECSFRDLKSLLGMDKIMNKDRTYLEKMLALLLIAYAIAMLIGEAIRDVLYAGVTPEKEVLAPPENSKRSPNWYRYSGLFLLIHRRIFLHSSVLRSVVRSVLRLFSSLVYGNVVRSFVST